MPKITSSHIVNIKDMFMDVNDVVLVYEVMDVSLRQITNLLVRPLKALHVLFCSSIGCRS